MLEIIKHNSSVEFYLNNKLCREGGPAMICGSGKIGYYTNNILHRTDGPALVWSDGYARYHLNGIWVTRDKVNVRDKKA